MSYWDEPRDDVKISDSGRSRPSSGGEVSFARRARTLSLPGSITECIPTRTADQQSPTLKFPDLSPDSTERVFPIRSVVSRGSVTPYSMQRPFPLETEGSPAGGGSIGSCASDYRDWNNFATTICKDSSFMPRMDGTKGGSSVFARRALKRGIDLSTNSPCERHSPEMKSLDTSPVHARGESTMKSPIHENYISFKRTILDDPAAVQSFEVVLVLDPTEYRVLAVSENCLKILGRSAEDLFQLGSWCDVLRKDQICSFLDHAASVKRKDNETDMYGASLLLLTVLGSGGSERTVWCSMHGTNEVLVCEIESPRYVACSNETANNTANQNLGRRQTCKYRKNRIRDANGLRQWGIQFNGTDITSDINCGECG